MGTLRDRTLIDGDDMAFCGSVDAVAEAVEAITRLCRVYHSGRIVGDKFVIRLLRPIASAHLVELQAKFDDSLTGPAELAPGPGEQELRSEERRVGKECRSRWWP